VNYRFRISDSPALTAQASRNFHALVRKLAVRADLILAWLLAFEWPALVISAVVLSPFTWDGATSSLNPHLLAAMLAGPFFIVPSILLALRHPGRHLRAVRRHRLHAARGSRVPRRRSSHRLRQHRIRIQKCHRGSIKQIYGYVVKSR